MQLLASGDLRCYDSRYNDSEHYYFRLYCSGEARISSCETSQARQRRVYSMRDDPFKSWFPYTKADVDSSCSEQMTIAPPLHK